MNDELCSLLHNASFDFFLENDEIQEFSGIMMLPPSFLSLCLFTFFCLSKIRETSYVIVLVARKYVFVR